MSLKDYILPLYMNTSTNNLIEEFYIPMLKNSVEYKRGVGFFSSGWLKMVSEGLSYLIMNGGRIKIITSPILSEEDYQALEKGIEKEEEIIDRSLSNSIEDIKKFIEENTLSAIAWMVSDGILEIKLAIPRNKLTGDFHDKFGIFTDREGNKVAFSGSPNESIQGFQNYESIKIFPSWREGFSEIVEAEENRFESLWNNEDPNVKVYSIPEASKEKILRLRTKERPYKEEDILKAFKNGNLLTKPRSYQKEAIDNWKKNNYKGIFEMATGVGKTLTSIFAINDYIKMNKGNLILIVVPFVHLVDQWEENIKLISDTNSIIKAYGNRKDWEINLRSKIILQNKGEIEDIFVISTIQTASKEDFLNLIHKSKVNPLIVIDECHYAGAPQFSRILDEFFKVRIGLSATPIRHWDEKGTNKIENYFDGIIYKFPLERAIKEGFLTPYEYHPILVELTNEEFNEYEKLTLKIGKILNNANLSEEEIQEKLEMLLIKRANILNRAANKLSSLEILLENFGNIKYSLFYCDPLQIDYVFDILKKRNIVAVKFTAQEGQKERKMILDKFAKGEIEALVAMKCLDEGVDVPATRYAFFLSSSTNERQFIQRRGRILRKYPDKEKSYIYDFIVIPPDNVALEQEVISILRRELERFKEFADYALNKYRAREVIFDLLNKYHLLDEV